MSAALYLCDDLLFGSRVTTTARALGYPLTLVRTVDVLLKHPDLANTQALLLDLSLVGNRLPELMTTVGQAVRVTGYESHVLVESLKTARELGVDAMPRSLFIKRLETSLADWLKSPSS